MPFTKWTPPLLLLLLPLLHPRCILRSEAVDLEGMRGCHRKLWENVMEVIVKIEMTNTMTNPWERKRQRQTKTKIDKDKNVGE